VSEPAATSDLIKFGMALLGSGAARNARRSIKSRVRVALLQAAAALCVMAALGCAMGGLWSYAAPIRGEAGALLAVAGVFAVIALGALGLVWRAGKKPSRRPASGSGGNTMLGEALSLFKRHKALGLIAALLAGVVVGSEG
jgi:hypothetical protein